MEEDENEIKFYLGHSPKKRSHSDPQNQDYQCLCVICLKKGGELVNPTERGLSTLYNAMKNVIDSCFNEQKVSGILDDTFFLILVKYHRICYQNYTSKHNQSYRQGIDFDQDCSTDTHDYLTRSGTEPMDVSRCLFCGCLKKGGDHRLVQIFTFPVQERIKNATKELGDHSLLAKVFRNDWITCRSQVSQELSDRNYNKSQEKRKKAIK